MNLHLDFHDDIEKCKYKLVKNSEKCDIMQKNNAHKCGGCYALQKDPINY